MKLRRQKQKPPADFRRHPGESRPAVFSYYASGNSGSNQNTGRNEAAQTKKQRPYLKFVYVPSYLALAILIIALLYSLSLRSDPKILLRSDTGTVYRSNQQYQGGVTSAWRRSILNLTKLTVRSGVIRDDIMAQYGELADVRIELPLLGRRPVVTLVPSHPALQLISTNGMFYVNDRGKTMAKTSEVTQNHLEDVPLIRDESGISEETGKNVLSETETLFLQKLSKQLKLEGIAVDSVTLPATAANEADIRVAGQAYFIKFATDSDPREAVGAYQVVKSKLDNAHIVPSMYIDVRVEQKVFYK